MRKNYTKESEKLLERKLAHGVKEKGGICLKLPAIHFAGIPDRLCLFPGGWFVFVELKTTGEKPRRIQSVVHSRLRRMGFEVLIIDKSEQIINLLKRP